MAGDAWMSKRGVVNIERGRQNFQFWLFRIRRHVNDIETTNAQRRHFGQGGKDQCDA
jgi:hypothetical protein